MVVVYLAGLSLVLVSSSTPWEADVGVLATVGAGAVVLFGLGVVTAKRRWRSPAAMLAFSAAVSLIVVAAIHLFVEFTRRSSAPPYSLYELKSIVAEIAFGYWLTLVVLLALVCFTALYAQSRALVDGLVALPILVWALESTRSHWLGFTGLSHSREVFVQFFWLGVIVSSLALGFVLVVAAVWRHLCGMRDVKFHQLSLVALTVLAVYADWAFSLFVTAMMLARQ